MAGKGHSGELSDANDNHVIGQQRKSNPCYKLANILAELCLCSSVQCKIKPSSDEIGYLTEELSKQNIEEVSWFLMTSNSKI